MMRRLLPLCALAMLAASEVDPAAALDLAAGDSALTAMAQACTPEALRAALGGEDAARRRGAARLLATGMVPAADLFDLLLACGDGEARRLGAVGLLGAALPPGRLLAFEDATVVAWLLTQHPEPWSDPVVRTRVKAWLADPTTCAAAAGLLIARGEARVWGADLVTVLAAPSAPDAVVAAAHRTLEHLTATQRNREVYGAHRDLLAADWRDVLAATTEAPAKADPALLTLVASLPDDEAVRGLLAHGPAALPAVEAAMAAGDKARRKALQPTARLLARGVTVHLWTTVGDAGLADLDAAEARARLACLRRIVAAVRSGGDRAGLLHLVRWLDDGDTRVRAAVLDHLVRLSDDKKAFGDQWELADGRNFPPAQVTWRLRRSLRDGDRDERLAALLFASSLKAEACSDAIVGMLIDGDLMVADAALDTLGHIGVKPAHLPVLVTIAQDATASPARRAAACARIAKLDGNSSLSSVNGTQVVDPPTAQFSAAASAMEDLLADPQPTVSAAAAAALVAITKDPSKRSALYARLVRDGRDELLVAALNDESEVNALAAMIPHLAGDGPTALAVARGLGAALEGDWEQPRTLRAALKTRLEAVASAPGASLPQRLAGLCVGVGYDSMLADLPDLSETVRPMVWRALVDGCAREPAALQRLCALAGAVPADQRDRLVGRGWRCAALDPAVLDAMVQCGQGGLGGLDSEESYSSDQRTRTVTRDAQRIVFSGRRRSGAHSGEDDLDYRWEAPADLAPAPDFSALRTALAAIDLPEEDRPALLRVLAALGGGDPPVTVDVVSNLDEWSVLAHLRPGLRAGVVAILEQAPRGALSAYELRGLLRQGEADMVSVVVNVWLTADKWNRTNLLRWLRSLPGATVRLHLEVLLTQSEDLPAKEVSALLRQAAPVPLPLALVLLRSGRLTVAVEPYTDAAPLRVALAALPGPTVLAQVVALKRLREAGPAAFDVVLAELCTRPDRVGAAWLRTGLPLEHLGREPYDRAFAGSEPHAWVVGAALHLKEGTLSPADFLAKLPGLPQTALADALAAAQRRLDGKTADQGPALAAVLREVPAGDCAGWLALCPADAAVADALAFRLTAGLPAELIAPAFAARLRADKPGWRALLPRCDAACGGRLGALLGAEAK